MEDLVKATDLLGYPGAPYSTSLVRAAGGSIRSECGWHIAPTLTETIEVETDRSKLALLPSLRVVDVTRVVDAETGRELTDWRVSPNSGVLRCKSGVWPEVLTVDLIHGYPACPPELLPIIAERAQHLRAGIVSQENIGGRAIAYRQDSYSHYHAVLARYQLPAVA